VFAVFVDIVTYPLVFIARANRAGSSEYSSKFHLRAQAVTHFKAIASRALKEDRVGHSARKPQGREQCFIKGYYLGEPRHTHINVIDVGALLVELHGFAAIAVGWSVVLVFMANAITGDDWVNRSIDSTIEPAHFGRDREVFS
jgi:hypothetical protein